MSLIKCNKCGEVYSDSYKKCPFCVEDEEYYNGKVKKRGHRQMEKRKKAPSVVGPVLVLAVLVLVGILVWAFAGDTVRGCSAATSSRRTLTPVRRRTSRSIRRWTTSRWSRHWRWITCPC